MVIKIAESEVEICACLPVLQELRQELNEATNFVSQVLSQKKQSGYRLVYLQVPKDSPSPNDSAGAAVVVAVAGFCVRENFAFGNHMYLQDLVTANAYRSKGYGSQLLEWLKVYARELSCTKLALDSGLSRKDAHRFYKREGVEVVGYVFATSVESIPPSPLVGNNNRRGSRQEDRRPMEIITAHYNVLLLATLGVWFCLILLDRHLQNDFAPYGMVSFQLVGTMENAQKILLSWNDNDAKLYAAMSLGLDYLFMVLYPATIGFACESFAASSASNNNHPERMIPRIGHILAWAQLGAGFLDAIENYMLLQILLNSLSSTTTKLLWAAPFLAMGCAIVKFTLIACGLGYILVMSCVRKKPKVE